jgi:hypothetical protein
MVVWAYVLSDAATASTAATASINAKIDKWHGVALAHITINAILFCLLFSHLSLKETIASPRAFKSVHMAKLCVHI